jgi:hypothetical protein
MNNNAHVTQKIYGGTSVEKFENFEEAQVRHTRTQGKH